MDSWHRGHTCVYGEAHRETVLLQSHTQATLFSKNICSCILTTIVLHMTFFTAQGGLYLKAANASRRGCGTHKKHGLRLGSKEHYA